ncbi:MAG TPA: aspartate carbamoyltransferase catalytic subunit [Acidimicrobiia bacterium]|nr:aspartate carbamoyltransferase catalytic subunit [Acidimicrobiia bacterium]
MKHLLSIDDLDRPGLEELLDLADHFTEVLKRDIPRVPALRGSTVATLFFEASTRTRLSFEMAAKALSADVLNFSPSGSSLSKGESLKDTVLTVQAMGTDLMVIRHGAVGAAHRVASWVDCSVVNGGDGAHQHPTQALLDALTLRRHFGKLDGLAVAIIGDIRNSRVARSNLTAFTLLGASVTLVAPPTFLPVDVSGWPVTIAFSLDEVLEEVDVVYLLRVQLERGSGPVLPSLPEYVERFGLDRRRYERMSKDAVVMHPGPMNRGIEIDPLVADSPRSLVQSQVSNGVAARMAVLFRILAGGMQP